MLDESLGNTQHPSAVVAIRLARFMGAKEIIMLCFDSFKGNMISFDPGEKILERYDYSRINTMTLEEITGSPHQFIFPCST